MIKRAYALLFIAAVCGFSLSAAQATIRYIDPNGTDSGTCGTGAKCQTYSYAIGIAAAGDDFEFSVGTYTLSGQAITGFSGTNANHTRVYCATQLGCYINGSTTFQPLSITGSAWAYMDIDGFKMKASGNNFGVGEVSGVDQSAATSHAHHITLSTCAMICNMATDNTAGLQFAFVQDSTITNVAVEGGRYSILIYSSRHITVERALVTWKSWGIGAGTQNPVAAFTVYNVYDSTMSNILAFDVKKPASNANTNDENAIYLVSNAAATGATYDHSENVSFLGCIVLNNRMDGAFTIEDNAVNARVTNFVVAGSTKTGVSARLNSTGQFNHVTVSSTGWLSGDGIFDDSNMTWINSNVAHGTGSANNGASMTFSNTFGYDDNTNAGSGNTQVNPNFKYIIVATNTAVAGTGSSSSDMGATVLYIYQRGAETTIPMWPWPNEDVFKYFMKDSSGFNYTDGVFAGTKTITSYVWEWKYGNPAPAQFASGGSGGASTPTGTPPADISTATISAGRMGMFGVNFNLLTTSSVWITEISSISGMGLGSFRSNWDQKRQIEQTAGVYTFGYMDYVMNLLNSSGLRVDYYYPLRSTLDAANPDCEAINPFFGFGATGATQCPPADLTNFNNFVSTIAYTYCEEIDTHEIYNEPSLLAAISTTTWYVAIATNAIKDIWAQCPGARIALPVLSTPKVSILHGGTTNNWVGHHWFTDFLSKFQPALSDIGPGVTLSSFTYDFHLYYDDAFGQQSLQIAMATMTAMLANYGVSTPTFIISETNKFGGSYTTADHDAEEVGKSSWTYRTFAMGLSPNSAWPNAVIKKITYHNFSGFNFSVSTKTCCSDYSQPTYSYYTLKKLAGLAGYTAIGDQGDGSNVRIFKFTKTGSNTKYVAWTESGTSSYSPGNATVTDVYGVETTSTGAITLTTAPQFIEVTASASGSIGGLKTIRGIKTIRGFGR